MKAIVSAYTGPQKVSILECPVTDPKGMRGMNAHLDWIMSQIDEDVVIITSADDLSLPGRNAAVVAAFEKHNPSMVLNAIYFADPDGTYYGTTAAKLEQDSFVDPIQCIEGLVGGSTAHAWTREFYEEAGPFEGICGFDAHWPFLATLRKGAWFIKEPNLVYVRHSDLNNTGLGGVYLATDEDKKLAVEELMHFQVATAYIHAARVMERWDCKNEEARMALYTQILGRAASWSKCREEMSVNRMQPLALKA